MYFETEGEDSLKDEPGFEPEVDAEAAEVEWEEGAPLEDFEDEQ
jgi:hypothetical protein